MENLRAERLCRLVEDIDGEIREFINTDILELELNKEETELKKLKRDRLRRAVRRCALGDRNARDTVKAKIKELLREHPFCKNSKALKKLFPFDNPDKVSGRDMFEYLYFDIGLGADNAFEAVCESLSISLRTKNKEDGYCISGEEIKRAYTERVKEVDMSVVEEVAVQRIYEELYGYGAADILIMDTSLDGVSGGCGGHTDDNLCAEDSRSCDTIYVMYHGCTVRMKFLGFGSEKVLERTVKKLCRNDAKTSLCRKTPYLVCSLADGSRIVASRPPYSPSWTFFVRRFSSSEGASIEELITDRGSSRAIMILKMLIRSEQNFVISGNQGGGKTTLLKSLIGFIDPRYTLRIAENNFELNINNTYPERNVHTLQEREMYSVYDSITAFKKMDSDVIILGEINEPKLAGAFVQLVQNGGRMAISTLHHNSTEKLIDYLRNALVSEFGICDVDIAERQVVDSLNFDVHMVRGKDGHHFIERITEIVPKEVSSDGSRNNYECHDILTYDNVTHSYVVTDMISETARGRIRATLGSRAVIDFCAFLREETGKAA